MSSDMDHFHRARELFVQGLAHFEKNEFDLAELNFRESLRLVPDRTSTITNLAAALIKQKKFPEAKELCLKLISIDGASVEGWNYLGLIDYEQSNLSEAIKNFNEALGINGKDAAVLNNKGIALEQMGQFEAALECFDIAVALSPDYAEAYYNRGNTLKALGRSDQALASYARALELEPSYADALGRPDKSPDADEQFLDEAQQAYARGDLARAESLCRGLLSTNADNVAALNLLGIVTARTQRPQEAAALLGRAVTITPDDAYAHNNLGNVLRELHRPDEALAEYGRAIEIKPDYAEAYCNRGAELQELNRPEEALESCDRAIHLKPDYAQAYNHRGNALLALKRFTEAQRDYEQAIRIKPDYAEAHNGRAVVLQETEQLDDALAGYNRALELRQDYAAAHYNRGNVLRALKRPEDAVRSYDEALRITPEFADALCGRGGALHELRRLDEALDNYDRAIGLNPDYVDAHRNRGCVLQQLMRLDAALDSFDHALKLQPDNAKVHYFRGETLRALNRLPDALESYDRALKLKPAQDFLYGEWLHTRMKLCDWRDIEANITECMEAVRNGEKSSTSFNLLGLCDSPVLQRKAAEIWVTNRRPANTVVLPIPKRARRRKIRIGYFSSDFHNHAITYVTAELFELHDRNRFELVGFSLGSPQFDDMRKRVSAAFGQFLDVQDRSEKDVALLSRNLEIDIAIDLNGFTFDARPEIFAYRAAPLQVHYMGYPGTLTAESIDYLVADPTLIPKTSQRYYAEKIIYLPNSYMVHDRKQRIADRRFTRQQLGLPEKSFVFCCFNGNYKITPAVFDGWMRILKQVEGSVLWLFADNATAAANLRSEAVARGVSGERLIFAERMPLPEHLARQRAADLFLDTLPYNAHSTASDALWAGLPVLTRIGESFAARVAASLLNAIDVRELITTSGQQYEALAVELAKNPERLEKIRDKLVRNRSIKPLFDTDLFARHVEDAYLQIFERYQKDLPPEHIYVQP